MIVRQVEWDHPHAVLLREAQRVEIDGRYGPGSEPGTAPSAADIAAFFVAYVDDEPVGCGGLRQLGDTEAEIKRMFVAASSRGTGVSTAVLHALEGFARTSGWRRLVLETGVLQPDAIRFYSREGYEPIAAFGSYIGVAASRCFAKELSDPKS